MPEKFPLKPLKIGCRAGLCACLFFSQVGFCQKHQKLPLCRAPIHTSYSSIFTSAVKIIPPCHCSQMLGELPYPNGEKLWEVSALNATKQAMCSQTGELAVVLRCNSDHSLWQSWSFTVFQTLISFAFVLYHHWILIKITKPVICRFLISFENLLKLMRRQPIRGVDLLPFRYWLQQLFLSLKKLWHQGHNVRFQIKGHLEASPASCSLNEW